MTLHLTLRSPFQKNPLALALGLALTAGAAHAELASLGVLPGYITSTARGVSDDGQVVVGYSSAMSGRAFRWTDGSGMTTLSGLPAGNSAAFGVSADGSVIVGTRYGSPTQAFVWSSGGVTNISLSGASVYGNDVSSDGAVVVGGVWDGSTGYAYRWTSSGGIQNLGTLSGHTEATASATNSDGSVVVGTSYGSSGSVARAFRWTSSGGMQDLGTLSGLSKSYANDVSGDGSIVVGYSCSGCYTDVRAFKWTSSGMVDLGTLGGSQAAAYGISRDGNVIVGQSYLADNTTTRAFRWQGGSMQSVEDWLSANGVSVASGLATKVAYATNADGSVVVGDLQDGTAFIARITSGSGGSGSGGSGSGGSGSGGSGSSSSGSGGGSGLITYQDIWNSLMQAAAQAGVALQQAGVILHGAHSRPLSRSVDANKNAFWVAGDLGRDEHGPRDGGFGLAEVGVGRNFGPLQVNVAAGNAWSDIDLPLGSRIEQSGPYLYAEGLIPLSTRDGEGLWAVLSGYHHWGDADIRRGYLNAGLPDHSTGNTDARAWAVSARLEWHNLLKAGDLTASPYADLSHMRVRTDAYTETGGGFPAAVNARSENVTDLRLGLNLSKPLGQANLIATLEAVHRFDDHASGATATILGPGGFTATVAGQAYKQNWLRAGVGIEGKVGAGIGSLMLNATSAGEMPSYWLAANWRVAF